MNRRDLLKLITLATGSALIGGELLFTACTPDRRTYRSPHFTKSDVDLLNEIGETILPRTQTPGAKDANVGEFMTKIVDHCYFEPEATTFHNGLKEIDTLSKSTYQNSFMNLQPEQRNELITSLDNQAKNYQRPEGGTPHFFTLIKQLTLLAFFTSEVGQTQVLRHLPIPGRYDGEMDYQPGDRAWALN
jgi:hypothetical protein